MNKMVYRFGVPIIVVIGLGIAILFWKPKKEQSNDTPKFSEAKVRESIPVPEVRFTDVTKAMGINFKHFSGITKEKLLPETMGSGVAFCDFDGDGLPDLLFLNCRPWPGKSAGEAKLPTMTMYRNLGKNQFQDVTMEYGLNIPLYGMGIAVGDYDNDGYNDFIVTCIGKHHLFHNEKGKRFVDVTDSIGIAMGQDLPEIKYDEFLKLETTIPWGSSATFLDYDGDGKLDLFICHYVSWNPQINLNIDSTLDGSHQAYAPPRDFNGAQCRLYRNIAGKSFVDVSEQAGIFVYPGGMSTSALAKRAVGKSLGVIVCDPDNDGWPDLIVANDTVRNFFFHNVPAKNDDGKTGGRQFVEIGQQSGIAYAEGTARGGMGIDWGEYSADHFGVVIANFSNEPYTFLNLDRPKQLLFRDVSKTAGLWGPSRVPLKFGTFFFDYDLDGRLDLLSTNGHLEPEIATVQGGQSYLQSAQLFWNCADKDCIYEEVKEKQCGPDLFKPIVGRGSAFADMDGDGDLDVVLTNNNGEPLLLRNDLRLGNHWLRLLLLGDGQSSNRSAIGAKIVVEANGQKWVRMVCGARGYLSQSEFPVTFGLGKIDQIDEVKIYWPGKSAKAESWRGLKVDQLHRLSQGTGTIIKE